MRTDSCGFSFSFAARARKMLFTLALFHAVGGRPALPEEARARFVGPVDSFLAAATGDAIARAESELANPRCEQVFSDFHNPSGTPLRVALNELGVTGGLYLRRLLFIDGGHRQFCSSGALAGTQPGSHVIYLCGSRFAAAHRTNPRLGAALVIHEELHSLGLSENPPSSLEITAGVLARCGS